MTTGVLRNPDFVRFLSSHVLNEVGANVARVALPLVAVLALHATPLEVGLLAASQGVALLLFGLPAGAWVDRMRRRKIMITADFTRFALLSCIPLANLFGVLSMPLMYGVALLAGCAQVFGDVADQTYLPTIVKKESLPDANSKTEFVRSAGWLSGPGVGGLLVQFFGAPMTLAATAFGALGSALVLSTIRSADPLPERGKRRGLLREVAEGFAFVRADRILRVLTISSTLSNLCLGGVLSLSALFLADVLELAPGVIGVLLASGGVGGIVGGLIGRRVFARYGAARVTWVAAALTSPFGLLLPMSQADWRAAFFAVTSIMITFGATLYNIGQVSYRQSATPPHLLGRVNATLRFATWGVMPIGALFGGFLGQHLGVREALWALFIGKALSPLPLFFSPLVRMREFDDVAQAKS